MAISPSAYSLQHRRGVSCIIPWTAEPGPLLRPAGPGPQVSVSAEESNRVQQDDATPSVRGRVTACGVRAKSWAASHRSVHRGQVNIYTKCYEYFYIRTVLIQEVVQSSSHL